MKVAAVNLLADKSAAGHDVRMLICSVGNHLVPETLQAKIKQRTE